MRILFVFDHLEVGGTQTYGQLLSREFIRAGHAVGVASRGGHTAPQFADAGAQIIIWPAPRRTDLRGVVKGIRRARQIIAAWSPDVIHAHAALPGLSFSLAARHSKPPRPPLIFGPQRSWRSLCHFPGGRLVTWALYQLLRLGADQVIAVSEGLRREFAANGIPAARLHLIPNGIDLDQFDWLAAAPIDLSFPPGPIVGTVGRLVAQKGMDVFLHAAGMIAPRQTDVTFVIAGDGPLRESCAAQVATLGLTGRAEMLGERRDIPALLQHLSVFVSASRWEGLPYALLEALAAQCPVVATRVLGSEELIQDGITGLLVPPDDPESLGRAILRLLDDPALARTLGANGRQLVNTRYRLQTLAEQVLTIYQQAIVVERPA